MLESVTGDSQWNELYVLTIVPRCLCNRLTYSHRMLSIIAAAVENTSWQGANGIVTEGADNTQNNDDIGFKGLHSLELQSCLSNNR